MSHRSTTKEIYTDIAWMGGAGIFDVMSTRYALSNCATCYEGNPFFREANGFKSGKAILMKSVVTAGTAYACHKLRKSGHTNAAKVSRWVVVAAWVGAGFWNVHQAR